MEITLPGLDAPHGWCSIALTDSFDNVRRKRLLSGVNLVRPLGPDLTNKPPQQVVETMTGRSIGRKAWHDPNLEVPGRNVFPLITIEPKIGLVMGSRFVRLLLDSSGLTFDPKSPPPDTVRHVQMDSSQCEIVQGWSLSNPTLLSVDAPALRQTVGEGVQRLNEGSLAIFTDRVGIDSLGIVVDALPRPGIGTVVTAFVLTDIFTSAQSLP